MSNVVELFYLGKTPYFPLVGAQRARSRRSSEGFYGHGVTNRFKQNLGYPSYDGHLRAVLR